MKLLSKIPKKALIASAAAGTAIVVGVTIALPKEESYRVIQVYEIEGTAQVTRENMGLMDAYENMQLENKDLADTGSDSYVQMKMDEDKYLLMEPNTSIRIEANGNETDSKTKIVLTKGAIVNRIEKKLSPESTYEVETPNSTMAVRGTQFRVAITEPDEYGNVYTSVEVYDGSVESVVNEIGPDGKITQKKVTVEAGKKITIKGTLQTAEFLGDVEDIVFDYDNPVLEFIGYMETEPTEIESINEETPFVDEEEKGSLEAESENETEKDSNSKKPLMKNETAPKEELEEEELSTDDLKDLNSLQNNNADSSNGGNAESGENSGSTSNQNPPSTDGSSGNAPSSEETSSEASSSEEPSSEVSSEETSSEASSEESSSELSSEEPSSEEASSEEASSEEPSVEPKSFTVTFSYNGATFATQTVMENNTAQVPELSPAASGSWAFDFSTPITQDTTIAWN